VQVGRRQAAHARLIGVIQLPAGMSHRDIGRFDQCLHNTEIAGHHGHAGQRLDVRNNFQRAGSRI